MYSLLIVDDHPIFRQGVIRIISKNPEFNVIEEVSTGEEAIEEIKKNHYDIVLLDITLPGRNGLDIIREIKALKPSIRILVLTMHSENQYALRSIKAGAFGYLTKEKAPHELVEALRTIASGHKYIHSSVTEDIISIWRKDDEKPLHETLSNREYEIFHMLVHGKRVSEIADELTISVKTVKTHRSRILLKMNMKSNAELIHYAFKHSLIEA